MNQRKTMMEIVAEKLKREMERVTENIMDPGAPATEKRKITMVLEFLPNENRDTVRVAISAKATLPAPYKENTILEVRRNDDGIIALMDCVAEQITMA